MAQPLPTVKAMTLRASGAFWLPECKGTGSSSVEFPVQFVQLWPRTDRCLLATPMPVLNIEYREVSAMQAKWVVFEFRFLSFGFLPTFRTIRSQALLARQNGGDAIGGGAMSVEERRGSVRFQPETLCYARVYVRQSHVWIAHDALVIDFSESHIRVSTDVPVGDQYRLCQHDAEDVRRSIEIRRDASGVVFEYGEPVERPEIEQLTSDLSFLEPHYDLLEAYLPTA